MSRTRTGEAGVALIHAIMFIGLLTTVVTVVTGPLLARAHAVRLHAERVQALYAAEAGVAEALAFLDDDGGIPSTIRGEIGVARYEVSLERGGAGAVVIRSTGTCGDQAHVEDRELPASSWAAGKTRVKTAPVPALPSTRISPSWVSTIRWTSARPSPVPPARVVWNG